MDLSAIDWLDLRSEDAIDMHCEHRAGQACEEAFIELNDLSQRYDDFNERFAGTFREHFASHERATYMIMAEAREILLVDNALAHLVDVQNRTQADMMTTIVALDAKVQEVCQNYSLPLQGRIDCVNLTGWMPEKLLGNVSNCFGSAPYKFLVSMKPFLLYRALNASRFGVLSMDADVIVRDDLLGYVRNASAVGHHPVMASIESWTNWTNTAIIPSNRTNTGVFFAKRPALPIIEAWSNLMKRRDWGRLGDQAAFDYLRRNFPAVNRSVEPIPIGLAAGGGWRAAYAGHYNACGRTVAEKIAFMKENGEWRGPA